MKSESNETTNGRTKTNWKIIWISNSNVINDFTKTNLV
jgi:hypothetical protein